VSDSKVVIVFYYWHWLPGNEAFKPPNHYAKTKLMEDFKANILL